MIRITTKIWCVLPWPTCCQLSTEFCENQLSRILRNPANKQTNEEANKESENITSSVEVNITQMRKKVSKRDCKKAVGYVVSADWTLPAEVINVANGPVAVDCGRIWRQRIAEFNCFSRALAAEITCHSRSIQRLSTNIILTELLQGRRSRQILTTAPSQCRKNSVKISCSGS